MSLREIFIKLSLFYLSICFSLLIIESILRWLGPPSTKYYIWRPNIHETFHPDPEIFPGIQGEGRLREGCYRRQKRIRHYAQGEMSR